MDMLAWLLAECVAGHARCTLNRHGLRDTIVICGIAPDNLQRQQIPDHAWTVEIERGRWVTVIEIGTKCEEA